jgi:hypothetical protein
MNFQFSELAIILGKTGEYAPGFGLGLLLLGAGWLFSLSIKFILSRGLALIGFDVLCDKLRITDFLRKGQVGYTPSNLMGVVVYWILLAAVLLIIADIAGIKILGTVMDLMVEKFPSIMATGLIIILGGILVIFISNFVQTIGNNAALPHAGFLARCIKWAGIVFIFSIGIETLQIGSKIVTFTFLILLAAIALGAALAFGIGGKDIAKDILERFIRNLEERNRKHHQEPDLEG